MAIEQKYLNLPTQPRIYIAGRAGYKMHPSYMVYIEPTGTHDCICMRIVESKKKRWLPHFAMFIKILQFSFCVS